MENKNCIFPRSDKVRINSSVSPILKMQIVEYSKKHHKNFSDALDELVKLGLAYVSMTDFLNNSVKEIEERKDFPLED